MTSLIGPTIPAEYAAAMARTSDDTTAGSGVTAPAQQEQEQLSHEEVWDDSALIDSWDEAVAEYKVGFRWTR